MRGYDRACSGTPRDTRSSALELSQVRIGDLKRTGVLRRDRNANTCELGGVGARGRDGARAGRGAPLVALLPRPHVSAAGHDQPAGPRRFPHRHPRVPSPRFLSPPFDTWRKSLSRSRARMRERERDGCGSCAGLRCAPDWAPCWARRSRTPAWSRCCTAPTPTSSGSSATWASTSSTSSTPASPARTSPTPRNRNNSRERECFFSQGVS